STHTPPRSEEGFKKVGEARTPAEEIFQILDSGVRVVNARPRLPGGPIEAAGGSSLLRAPPLAAKLIVFGSLFRVAQNLVGLVNLLKSLLGRFVARIHVRVILAGQAAVGAPNLFLVGIP